MKSLALSGPSSDTAQSRHSAPRGWTAKRNEAHDGLAESFTMRSSKSRSRNNKNRNNRPSGGNLINRVFDSSGPDGKVRGTPQQIIDKYNQLHRDAQLSGDRVNAENFAQHAEHYLRMLSEAQKEVDRQREEQEEQNRQRQAERDRERAEQEELNRQRQSERDRERNERLRAQEEASNGSAEQSEDSGLVETPESKGDAQPEAAPEKPKRKPRAPRKPKAKPAEADEQANSDAQADQG